jgi:hypothetical protein
MSDFCFDATGMLIPCPELIEIPDGAIELPDFTQTMQQFGLTDQQIDSLWGITNQGQIVPAADQIQAILTLDTDLAMLETFDVNAWLESQDDEAISQLGAGLEPPIQGDIDIPALVELVGITDLTQAQGYLDALEAGQPIFISPEAEALFGNLTDLKSLLWSIHDSIPEDIATVPLSELRAAVYDFILEFEVEMNFIGSLTLMLADALGINEETARNLLIWLLAVLTAAASATTAEDLARRVQQILDELNNQIQHWILAQRQPTPLRPDEEKHIDRINGTEEWIADHPDLEADAREVNAGGELEEGFDHVREARQRIEMLENAIRSLEIVRRSRIPEDQARIDEAIESAQEYIRRLKEILDAGQS